MSELFEEIIREAKLGEVIIDGDPFPIHFDTQIFRDGNNIFTNVSDNFSPTLVINDEKKFYDKLEEYVALALNKHLYFPSFLKEENRNKIKILISYLFVNATTEELLNPIRLLEKNIAFLQDDTFEYLNDPIEIPLLNSFQNSYLKIQNVKSSIFMESPYKMDISLIKRIDGNTVEHVLPSVFYGIQSKDNEKKQCVIFSVLYPKVQLEDTKDQLLYTKKITRELYKVHAGVFESETAEYKDYKEGNSYYPENIMDVSPAAIVTLHVFMSLLEKENINHIQAIPYLPVRYLSRDRMADSYQKKDMERACALHERNDLIQSNITEKFIRDFRRMEYHLNGLKIQSYPYENSEYMEMQLSPGNHYIENEILSDVYNAVQSGVVKKKNVK